MKRENFKRGIGIIIILIMSFAFSSCISIPASATATGPRTLILDGKSYTEDDVGGFISWYCVDFVNKGSVLVEVGYFGAERLKGIGFILYDNSSTGNFTQYARQGLEHRWDWGKNAQYSFVIKNDNTGLYYDFTGLKSGTSIKAREVYKAYKR
jgi:hypothetical protein